MELSTPLQIAVFLQNCVAAYRSQVKSIKKLHSCSSNTFFKRNIFHGNNWFSLQYYDSPQDDLVKENFMFTDKWMDMKSSQLHYMSAICLLTARNWADAMGKNKVEKKPKLNKFMNNLTWIFLFFKDFWSN